MSTVNIVRQLSRREFMKVSAMTAAGVALGGCAKNPVTGRSQFMLVSEEQEIAMDRKAAPLQLSNDYGPVQDSALNAYVTEVGERVDEKTHRPHMPYSYRVVNANYVNAYAFPGGTIACTRGIMLGVDNEAELSALLGHEVGHVNARHTASRMSTQVLAGTIAGIGGAVVGAKYGGEWGALAGGLGGVGVGLLLASYSRADEREADALGMEYMTNAGYNPDGMVGLMDMLNEQHDREPSALEVMFSTHPMSSERLATAKREANTKYLGAKQYKVYRERYMDNTAELRSIKPAIEEMQTAEKLMGQVKYTDAEGHMKTALKQAPNDYTGLLLMSKCQIAQEKYDEALPYAKKAHEVYPEEAQASQVTGLLYVKSEKYAAAFDSFSAYEKAMPNNPYAAFFKGFSQEGMGNKQAAAQEYVRFLKQVNQGAQAQHAYYRLVEWGYIKGEAEPVGNPLAGIV